jgi:hypothetical protein
MICTNLTCKCRLIPKVSETTPEDWSLLSKMRADAFHQATKSVAEGRTVTIVLRSERPIVPVSIVGGTL